MKLEVLCVKKPVNTDFGVKGYNMRGLENIGREIQAVAKDALTSTVEMVVRQVHLYASTAEWTIANQQCLENLCPL